LSYRPASLFSLSGWYDNPMPKSTVSPPVKDYEFCYMFCDAFHLFYSSDKYRYPPPHPPSAFLPFSASPPLPLSPLLKGQTFHLGGVFKNSKINIAKKKTGHSLCIYRCFILQYFQRTSEKICIEIRRFFNPHFAAAWKLSLVLIGPYVTCLNAIGQLCHVIG
jgi:hypothetical protein